MNIEMVLKDAKDNSFQVGVLKTNIERVKLPIFSKYTQSWGNVLSLYLQI